ncbi:MAG: heavy-metal-associated domain-containing protein [Lacisediminihabitans sp.]
MRTVKFETEPFSCPSCAGEIESVVIKKVGVDTAQVMFSSSKIKVAFDESKISVDDIAESITKLGYPILRQKVA